MKITCVSDLHGEQPELEGGDLLILAGDYTASSKIPQWCEFFSWVKKQNYHKKIMIAGNHDSLFEHGYPKTQQEADELKEVQSILMEQELMEEEDFEYLCDSRAEFNGMKIWGSPWTPSFGNWYFMKDRGEDIKKMWDLIPDDTEILITHGPPFGILDEVTRSSKYRIVERCGCHHLRSSLERLKNLKLHIFGHIHEGYGQVEIDGVTYINCSIMNGDYESVNKPINIII